MDAGEPSAVGSAARASCPPPTYIDQRYCIEAELGRGGMGAVYRARDEGSGRTVALKILASRDPRLTALFEREYRTLSKLTHPRVIQVYDFGFTAEHQRYYTMELIAGRDLFACTPAPWLAACSYLRDVCTSLALLHAQRLIHRDVNPRNVRLDQSGRAKLLDFGALTQFGFQTELVGTAICAAPEAVRGLALDGRTDLFSLGVVAYLTLTGRVPFPITDLRAAEPLWAVAPLAPSQLVPELPSALDELILSLLSIDPLGRPMSAADVIDRLDAITVTDDESVVSIADSHIASSPLVGRRAEQQELARLLRGTRAGQGAVLTIEGEAGAGKSRLLTELRIEAELGGLACLQLGADACMARESAGLALVRGLLEVAPQVVRTSATLQVAALMPLLQRLGEPALANITWDTSGLDDNQRAACTEAALATLVLAVARHKPLLISIDDVHLLPDASAHLLRLLGDATRRGPLLLAVASLPESPQRAVVELRQLGGTLRLAELDSGAVEQLVDAAFGDVPHRTRLAQWLWSATRGHPGQLHALLHELLGRHIVRYAGGAWSLPAEIPEALLSDNLREQAAARLARLDSRARSLAVVLAAHHGSLSDTLLSSIFPNENRQSLLDALARLCEARLVVSRDAEHRLSYESIRQAVLDPLTPAQRTAVHSSLANALWKRHPDAIAAIQTGAIASLQVHEIVYGIALGYHLLRSGQFVTGVSFLRGGAIELTVRGQGLVAAAPYLEAAVEFLRQRGDGVRVYGALLTALTLAGTYTDWRLSYRYGDEMLTALADVAGVTLARRLTRYLGGALALYVGLLWGLLVYGCMPHKRMSNNYRELLLGLMGIGSAILGVCPVLHDNKRARSTVEQLSPLHHFPRTHPVYMVHEFQLALFDNAAGRYEQSHTRCRHVLTYLRSERAKRSLPQTARTQLEGGLLNMQVQLDSLRTDGSAERTIAAIQALDSPTSAQTYAAARVAYHGHRGEREPYLRALEQLDRSAAESGSTWRSDVSTIRMLWSTHALCEDVLSLKRAVQQLQTLASEVPSIARLRNLTEACYLCERGLSVDALTRYGAVFEMAWNEPGLRAAQELGAYARILRKAGQSARARDVCERALLAVNTNEQHFELLTFGLHSELALALAALGATARATELAENLLTTHLRHDNPLLRGLSHGVCAQVALCADDGTTFDSQIALMHQCFQRTQHPALFAQCQRLYERARRPRLPAANDQSQPALTLEDSLLETRLG